LSEHPIEPGPQLVAVATIAYAERARGRQARAGEAVLAALAQTYDPHSEYLSKADLKNFSINMGLSLVGIGAMLHSEDGYAKIQSLVVGGPAQKHGGIKVGDRITAVAQGSAEFNDVRDMRLDKVVEQIRGKKGTKVRLLVIPADAADPSKRKTIEIVRDEIKLKTRKRAPTSSSRTTRMGNR
jgi:carboxyl-terminal processing protease